MLKFFVSEKQAWPQRNFLLQKKCPQLLQFFIYISPTIDSLSISGSFEDLTTNQSYGSHSSQFLETALLFSCQANITSITNMQSINDSKMYFLKCCWLQTLCTLKTMKLLENIPSIKYIIRIHSYQHTELWLRLSF